MLLIRKLYTKFGKLFLVLAYTLVFSLNSAYSQLNLKVAYNLDYSSYTVHNGIFADYNMDRDWLAQEFNNLRFTNGLQLGLRFRGKYLGTDLSWERSSADRSAQGIMPNGENHRNELEYVVNRFALGLETYRANIGLGINVYYERLGISSPLAELESNQEVINGGRFGNRIYLILSTTGSDRLSLSLQPYVAIPWQHLELSPLASHLGITNTGSYLQKNTHFGLSVVFYNGAQRN